MEILLGILAVLLFITVVGHLIWLALAAMFRFLFAIPSDQHVEPVRRSLAEGELHDLEVTTRTIQALLARGELDRETADRLGERLEARRWVLQKRQAPPAVRVAALAPDVSVAQLEELLGEGPHPRDWPVERRQAALACYRQLNNNQRAALKGPTLLAMARLLAMAGMTSHALAAYRRLLDDYTVSDRARVALEAGRLAVREDRTELARHFLRLALDGVLLGEEYEEVQTLLGRLDESVQAPAAITAPAPPVVAEVIPVEPTVVSAIAPAPVAKLTPVVPPIVAPELPPRPRRSLSSVLAAFMEERNILWGELTGGLLIVGCSIALVITLWHSLEELPYFPFLLFACITAALFGAGEYTLHHWKLQSTSRGLLVIALLLVPLNLLVLADPSLGQADSALEWIFKSGAILLSLGMIRLAGRDLIGVGVLPGPVDRRWLFMLAIVGAAGSQLVVPRLADGQHPGVFVALGCIPVGCHLLACGAVVAGLARARARAENARIELRQADALFVFLGLASFALFVALGFLLSRGGVMALAVPRLAVPFALAGVPILAGGLLVRRGLPDEESGPRTAGTAVAFAGLALMLSAVALAWPRPEPLLLVCVADAAILSVLAFRWRMPYAHAAALPCLALAVLLIVQLALGHLAELPEATPGWWLAEQLFSPSGGIALAILMALLAAGAEGLARAGRHVHAASYALGSAALGLGALLTTACHGVESPWPAALVHALAGGCALAMFARWRRPALPYTGLGLLVAASLWGLWAFAPDNLALWGFVLALESSALAAAAVRPHMLDRACREVATVTAVLALVLALVLPGQLVQGLHTATAALLALTAFLLARGYQRPELAWVGSTFGFAALAHLLLWDLGAFAIPRPLLMALAVHATLALLGVILLQARRAEGWSVLWAPLSQAARLTSVLAVPLLLWPGEAPLVQAGFALWLALLWLVIAWMQRGPAWFTAFQAALSAAVVFTVRTALPGQHWAEPVCLQAYGIGLGLLGLGWIAARAVLGSHPRVRQLWEAPWPALDHQMLAYLVAGQLLLVLWGVAPGVIAELTPAGYVSLLTWPPEPVFGPRAWALLGVLAVVLLAALRHRGDAPIVLGLLVLAVTVPVLAAGPFASEQATASALRWGLAACYVVCSALVWLRRTLARGATAAGVTFVPDSAAVAWSHTLLAVVAAVVLLLTGQVAALGFAGLRPSGPAPGSLFAEMGWVLSNVGPLVLLTAGLVGHAVRERSPLYAFIAGLVAEVTVAGGYALGVVVAGGSLGAAENVCLVQLTSLTAALWALGWMLSLPALKKWYGVDGEVVRLPSALGRALLMVHIALALAGQLVLLGGGVLILGDLKAELMAWLIAAGSPLGWAALLASLAAVFAWHRQQLRLASWGWLFVGGLAAVGLLACSVERAWPGAGYHVLILGWPAYVVLWAALPFVSAAIRQGSEPNALRRFFSFAGFESAAPAILAPCVLVVRWALHGADVRQDYVWAAVAVALCGAASALLAVWRRSEVLAFLAGLAANLATSLVVWQWYHPRPPAWLAVVQANVIASASVALAWLGIRRLLAERRPGPLLALQSALGLGAHTVLMLLPLGTLLAEPGVPPGPLFADIGSVAGWAALVLSAIAMFWDLAVRAPRGRLHVLAITGVSAGILAACTASPWDTGNWLSYHVLLLAWCLLGLAGTAIASVLFSFRVTGLSDEGGEVHARRFADIFRPRALRHWLEGIGLAILVLTLPSTWGDPLRPMVPAGAVLAVSLMAGVLAIGTRRPHYVWISGLLLDLVGLLFWWAWGPGTPISFVLMNALGLAVAAAFWTGIDLALSNVLNVVEQTPLSLRRFLHTPFAHVAVLIALGLVVLAVVFLVGSDMPPPLAAPDGLAWAALAAVAVALVVALADRRAVFAPPGLYVLGLSAVGLVLHQLKRTPAEIGWSATLMLAAYTVLASLMAHAGRRWREHWLLVMQTTVAAVVIALSLWVCLDFGAVTERLAGPAAVLLLTLAAIVLVQVEEGAVGEWLRVVALALGVLAAGQIGWACPDPGGASPWLYRNVLLMVALAGTTALYGVALPRWLAGDPAWVRCARRVGPILGGLASLTLLVLLVQEFRLYDPIARRTPMAWPAVAVVLAALVTLMVSGIRFAVVPGRDPLGLSERGRTLYVYAVELLLVLAFVHLRMTEPQLFGGFLSRYWMFVAMLIAFAGVGLSEFFERRKLRVLAEPLQRTGVFLPVLPLLAFWVKPLTPNLPPLLQTLLRHNPSLNTYATLWLLVCGLYALVSLTRRSFVFALLAALAANFALWSLLAQYGVAFLLHPQCWLIPLALIVLVSEHLNRDRLRPELSAALRYLGICMIYVSSTADLFIAGLGNSVVLPVVLAVLSLAGILVGILIRVRAFLFLGISFLFLDVFTMIWYAAVDRYQTWVWWVSGIVLGVAILTLFAVFEKRRNDVLHLLEEIKNWD
jgi:hypothetical protein